jgi:hypothetical protein
MLQKSRVLQIQGVKGEAVVVFWMSLTVNSTKLLKKMAKKGCCCFSEPFAMLFMQL